MAAIFLGLAAFLVTLGVLFLSQATYGVGGIAVGLFFAVVARVVQARAHHDELMRALAAKQ